MCLQPVSGFFPWTYLRSPLDLGKTREFHQVLNDLGGEI